MDISFCKREKVSILLESELSSSIPVPWSIQGHSGSIVDPALQDNVLLPEGLPSTSITSERKRIEVINSE